MANPNLINVSAVYGNSSNTALSSTSVTSLVSNAASSGKVYKINSIVVLLPADATLIITDKTTSFYLLENQSIGAIAGSANDLVITASWEELN
jgi:hypothetical protein